VNIGARERAHGAVNGTGLIRGQPDLLARNRSPGVVLGRFETSVKEDSVCVE
jgi:hypothetical protein